MKSAKENHACKQSTQKKKMKEIRKLLTQISWIKSKCYRFFSPTLTSSFSFSSSFSFISSLNFLVRAMSCYCYGIEGCDPRTANSEQRIVNRVLFNCVCSTANCISSKRVAEKNTMNFRSEKKSTCS